MFVKLIEIVYSSLDFAVDPTKEWKLKDTATGEVTTIPGNPDANKPWERELRINPDAVIEIRENGDYYTTLVCADRERVVIGGRNWVQLKLDGAPR